jgi:hypothetical protein
VTKETNGRIEIAAGSIRIYPDGDLLQDVIAQLQSLVDENMHRQVFDISTYDDSYEISVKSYRLETDAEYEARLKKEKVWQLAQMSEKAKKIKEYENLKLELKRKGWIEGKE